MRAGCNRGRDLGEVKRHALGIAAGQNETGRLALSGADRTIDVGRCRPLVLRRQRTCTTPSPATRDPVLLADPSLVLPPNLYGRAAWGRRADRRQLGREGFLKAGMASSSCA